MVLPGRGTTVIRDVAGPPGAPTVVLLHGLGATASINWPGAFDELAPWFRVVALDQAGHGRGVRSRWPFRLEDCADDVVRLADVLGIERVVTVGYSMGGPVALLARRRHPSPRERSRAVRDRGPVRGRATLARQPLEGALAAGLRLTPPAVRRGVSQTMLRHATRDSAVPPALLEEVRGHDPAALVEAMRALGRFDARPWLAELRCPTVSVITARDRLVPPSRQLELAAATGARVVRIDADHLGAVGDRARFLPALGVGLPVRRRSRRHGRHRLIEASRTAAVQIGVVFPQTEIGAAVGRRPRATRESVEELGFAHLLAYDHVLGADPEVHAPGRAVRRPHDVPRAVRAVRLPRRRARRSSS